MLHRSDTARARARLSILLTFAVILALSAAAPAAAQGFEPRPLMTCPDVRGDLVVFGHGGDIWSVPASGGIARRLTIDPGLERCPRISPDGHMIAFTAEYDGNSDVYVMSTEGGHVTRLTYHPGEDEVIGWHPMGTKILFRSSRNSFSRFSRLYLVNFDGSQLEELPMPEAGWGSFSPDGKQIVYTRVATDERTWKRYRGGLAPDLYLYDLETKQDRRLTDFPGTDALPLWIGDAIYFVSDRDGRLNLYRLNPSTGKAEQMTHHQDFDARRPGGGDRIVYELGGRLQLFDPKTGETAKIKIGVIQDMPERRPYLKHVVGDITQIDVSPGGERAAIVARGEIFTAPRKDGPIRNVSHNSGARDKDAAWSPDGQKIAYLSDLSGEYDIWVVDAFGRLPATRLTQSKDGYRHTLLWSPDGKKIAFADQTLRVYYVDVDTKQVTEVDHAEYEPMDVAMDRKPISDFAWSPDSAFLAYSKMGADLVSRLYIYSMAEKKARQVSDGLFNDFGPVFGRDGEHLFFVSNRRFDPTYDDFQFEFVFKKVAGVYALTLRKDGPALLPLKSDDPTGAGEASAADKSKDAKAKDAKSKDEKAPNKVVIDWDGLYARTEALPLPRGNYRQLAAGKDAVFFLDSPEGDYNRFEFRDLPPRTLSAFEIQARKTRTVIEGIDDYRLSADASRIVYHKGESVGIIDASAENSKGEPLNLADLKMTIDPPAEWMQIYNEAWRIERDFFYDPGMRGLNWAAVAKKYGLLLGYASDRRDVTYLIGEMIGELNTSHTYVFGGDRRRRAERVQTGLLGADYELDQDTDRYRFKKIYRTPEWTADVVPPLAAAGVDVREGEYLVAVNGVDVYAPKEVYAFFQGLAGQQVTLLVNSKPVRAGAREVVVKPIADESELRYLDWTEHNRQLVDKASDGQIGYIHLPDTFTGSAREFPKWFFSQTQKKGLIIDGRYNSGGLDPYPFLERLAKPTLSYWTRRYSHDQTGPDVVTRAHMAMLINRQAGSGGDELPAQFRQLGLGPLIGTRTWGGLVGLSAFYSLIDGGAVSAPDYRVYTPAGKWEVENEGVAPDIEVDLDPAQYSQGIDSQLMKAVEVLKEKIQKDPRPAPQRPTVPLEEEAPQDIRRK